MWIMLNENLFFFIQSIAMIESNLLPEESYCTECQCWGAPRELQPVTMVKKA